MLKNIKFEDREEKHFLIISSVLSVIIGVLFIWKTLVEGSVPLSLIVIGMAFLYVPVLWLFRKKGFVIYTLVFSVLLIYLISFYQSKLYNNFTGLLAVFVVMMVMPKVKWWALGLYFTAVCVSFALNDESLCHFLIHVTRGAWFFEVFDYVLLEKYQRKKLVLYDDEIKILTALSKNKLQKSLEVEGYSESTIYRRIKAACKRNNLTKSELITQFQKENPFEV